MTAVLLEQLHKMGVPLVLVPPKTTFPAVRPCLNPYIERSLGGDREEVNSRSPMLVALPGYSRTTNVDGVYYMFGHREPLARVLRFFYAFEFLSRCDRSGVGKSGKYLSDAKSAFSSWIRRQLPWSFSALMEVVHQPRRDGGYRSSDKPAARFDLHPRWAPCCHALNDICPSSWMWAAGPVSTVRRPEGRTVSSTKFPESGYAPIDARDTSWCNEQLSLFQMTQLPDLCVGLSDVDLRRLFTRRPHRVNTWMRVCHAGEVLGASPSASRDDPSRRAAYSTRLTTGFASSDGRRQSIYGLSAVHQITRTSGYRGYRHS